jgi:CRP-like cAMP-binding protein
MKSIAEVLSGFPLTEGMSQEQLELIAGCARNQAYPPGTYLFREGEAADTFWAVRTGRIALEAHAPGRDALIVETVAADDILGWSWIFPPYQYVFDARVLEQARTIAFDGACLRGKSEADHELGYELMRRMARVFTQRLAAARLQLMDLYRPAGS